MNKMRFIVPDILVGKPLLLELPGYRQLLTRELRHPYSRAGQLEKKAIFTQRGTTTLQKKKNCAITRFSRQMLFQLKTAPRAFHYQVTALQNLHRQEVFCKSHVTHTWLAAKVKGGPLTTKLPAATGQEDRLSQRAGFPSITCWSLGSDAHFRGPEKSPSTAPILTSPPTAFPGREAGCRSHPDHRAHRAGL